MFRLYTGVGASGQHVLCIDAVSLHSPLAVAAACLKTVASCHTVDAPDSGHGQFFTGKKAALQY